MPYKKNKSGKLQYYDEKTGRWGNGNITIIDKPTNVSYKKDDLAYLKGKTGNLTTPNLQETETIRDFISLIPPLYNYCQIDMNGLEEKEQKEIIENLQKVANDFPIVFSNILFLGTSKNIADDILGQTKYRFTGDIVEFKVLLNVNWYGDKENKENATYSVGETITHEMGHIVDLFLFGDFGKMKYSQMKERRKEIFDFVNENKVRNLEDGEINEIIADSFIYHYNGENNAYYEHIFNLLKKEYTEIGGK